MKRVTTERGTFWIDERDEFIGRKLETEGAYSEDELRLLETCVNPHKDVLIVGAHIGAFAIPLSRRCRTLVAVEANPHTYALLLRNVSTNGCDNVKVVFGAASDAKGTVPFLCGTANSGGSKRMPVTMRDDYLYDKPDIITVGTFRLDDHYVSDYGLVHMDIEGSEVFALRGAQEILKRTEFLSVEFISHHLTHVAGVTVDEWLEPIEPHYNKMLLPGDTKLGRPHIALNKEDWREMLNGIVAAGVGIEELIFWRG